MCACGKKAVLSPEQVQAMRDQSGTPTVSATVGAPPSSGQKNDGK